MLVKIQVSRHIHACVRVHTHTHNGLRAKEWWNRGLGEGQQCVCVECVECSVH